MALLGSRVPVGGKLFLLALAIADDIGAITVIAVFYTDDLAIGYLAASVAMLVAIWISSRIGIRSFAFYVPAGIAAWFFLFESGVHATLAGVALGLLTPTWSLYSDRDYHRRTSRILGRYDFSTDAPRGSERLDSDALTVAAISKESVPPLHRIERALHPWSSFFVVPLFALANAGVRFNDVDFVDAATHPVALGVALGLLVGKVIGISAFAWLAVKLRLGVLPRLTSWRHVVGLSAVAGVGFTVSLFVAGLAFDAADITDRAKIGIFIGSGLAGLIGFTLLRSLPARSPEGIGTE